ncbi:hypothetical protein A2U01_0016318 [Trifolium medium]|uniref:Uncharacterized protein n=1 Tax=Trifolium medium TaxID=97028 RepID=A0A392N6X8_9FABA|nr:hypothetical protein [Trifolium medium]
MRSARSLARARIERELVRESLKGSRIHRRIEKIGEVRVLEGIIENCFWLRTNVAQFMSLAMRGCPAGILQKLAVAPGSR